MPMAVRTAPGMGWGVRLRRRMAARTWSICSGVAWLFMTTSMGFSLVRGSPHDSRRCSPGKPARRWPPRLGRFIIPHTLPPSAQEKPAMHRLVLAALLALACGTFAQTPDASKAPPADWPQWRGPSGQGYASDARVPLTWGETENVLWKTALPGKGNSPPVVWGDRVFLTSAGEGGATRSVLCIRATDGKLLWEKIAAKGVPQEKTHAWNGHASPSCVTDGKHVWAFFGTPGLFCYDLDGTLVWKKTFGTFHSAAGWGTAASPFLYEDTVILNCDNDGGRIAAPPALVAMEKTTGKLRWSTPREGGRGYSTPRLMKVASGRTDLVLNGPIGTWGYDPA